MTMITLILASLVMVGVGLVGGAGIFVAVIIGCAVCTALSTSGALIGDFKIGYWIGATPRRQQAWKFLGVAVAALVVAIVVPVMDNAYHFMVPIDPNSIPIFDPANPIAGMMANTEALPAPQASMLAEIVRALMGGGSQPYLLYGLGAFIALMLVMAGVPPLPFALGMYLPISINVAVLFGGLVSWAVGKSSKDKEVAKARAGQGTLIASGLMAGAAIFGIVAALFRIDWNEFFGSNVGFLRYPIRYLSIGVDYVVGTTAAGATYLSHAPHPEPTFYESTGGQVVGLIMFVGLAVAVFLLARWGANMEVYIIGDVRDRGGSLFTRQRWRNDGVCFIIIIRFRTTWVCGVIDLSITIIIDTIFAESADERIRHTACIEITTTDIYLTI